MGERKDFVDINIFFVMISYRNKDSGKKEENTIQSFYVKQNSLERCGKDISACLLGLKWIGPVLVMVIFRIIKIISYPMREVSLSPLHHFWSHKA